MLIPQISFVDADPIGARGVDLNVSLAISRGLLLYVCLVRVCGDPTAQHWNWLLLYLLARKGGITILERTRGRYFSLCRLDADGLASWMLLSGRFNAATLCLSIRVQLWVLVFLWSFLDRSSPLGCALLLAVAVELLGNLRLQLSCFASCLCHRLFFALL